MPAQKNISKLSAYLTEVAGGGYLGGLGLGSATLALESSPAGISSLDLMPSPLTAPLWGAFMTPVRAASILNPFSGEGTGTRGYGIFNRQAKIPYANPIMAGQFGLSFDASGAKIRTGRNFQKAFPFLGPKTEFYRKLKSIEYGGPIGFRTLLTGMPDKMGIKQGFALGSRLSIGNMVLSATESVGHAAISAGWEAPMFRTMRHAKSLGLAGMLNLVDDADFLSKTPDKLKSAWLYKLAGVDPKTLKVGAEITYAKGVSKFAPKITEVGKLALGAGGAAKAFATAAAGFSLYTYLDLMSGAVKFTADTFVKGIGGLAVSINQWLDERKGLELGYGRLPTAMISSAAATERQRAVRASYGAKINPRNRLMGNEATYHHTR
jgi:hypothetical protein